MNHGVVCRPGGREATFAVMQVLHLDVTSYPTVDMRSIRDADDANDRDADVSRWQGAADDVRDFVSHHRLTEDGAVAGGTAVDVSAALLPAGGCIEARAPEMIAAPAALERDHPWNGLLHRRHLACEDAKAEGAFLAGTFWVAQDWASYGDARRADAIVAAAMGYANDAGSFSEEADPGSPDDRACPGDVPRSFVHAASIGAIVDLRHLLLKNDSLTVERTPISS